MSALLKNSTGVGLIALTLGIASPSEAGKGSIDAASITVRIHGFAVSKNKDCSSPVVVFSSSIGVENDLLSSPTYGSGPVDPGSYECVIIELSKVIKTSAASSSGSCTQGQVFSDVICRDGQGSQLLDGTSVTCSGGDANPQHVAVYVTTVSAGQGGERALLPPSSANDVTSGLKLSGPLVVGGDTPVTLSVDPKKFLDGSGSSCGTSAPGFSVE